MGMGINYWEWEGMGLTKIFPLSLVSLTKSSLNVKDNVCNCMETTSLARLNGIPVVNLLVDIVALWRYRGTVKVRIGDNKPFNYDLSCISVSA